MVRKKEDIENKYQLVAYLVRTQWWKIVIILAVVGFFVTGFKCGWLDFQKDPILLKSGTSNIPQVGNE